MPDPGDRAIYGEPEAAPSRRSRLGGIVAVLAMLGFGVGLWYVYDRNIRKGEGRAPTVVAADTAPVKSAPANPGGMQVANQQTAILNQGKKPVEPKVESLLPPPERPKAEPPPAPKAAIPAAPPPLPQAAAPQPAPSMPAAPATPVEVAKVPTPDVPKAEPSPAPQAAPPPAPVAVAPPPPSVPPPTSPPAPAPAAPAAAPPAGGGVRIQLASLPDAATAEQEWKRLQRANADVLGSLSLRVVPVQLEGKGTWYRLQAGPFADKAGAQSACETLKQRKLGCFLAP